MKRRFILILPFLAIILLVGTVVFFAYKSKYSADSLFENDSSFLDSLSAQPNLNDPTLIRLPERYNSEEIKSALKTPFQAPSGSKAAISAKSQEILGFIRNQQNTIAKSLPIQNGTDDQPAMNDLLFQIADSSGQVINIEATATTSTAATIADNFDFDVTVPEPVRQEMIEAYPIIESIYGPRQNGDKIDVYANIDLDRAWASGNHIELDNRVLSQTDRDTDSPIHELVHAFHGYRQIPGLWDEGMAVWVTTYVEKQMNLPLDEYYLIRAGYYLNFENLPSTFDPDINNIHNPWLLALPYRYGSMIIDKVMLENKNFLKNFNSRLYQTNGYSTKSRLLQIAISSVAAIENQPSRLWFASQFPYIPRDPYDRSLQFFTELAGSVYTGFNCEEGRAGSAITDSSPSACQLNIQIHYQSDSDNQNFSVRLLDTSNNVLIGSGYFKKGSSWYGNQILYSLNIPSSYKNYYGLVRIEITPNGTASAKRTFSFLKVRSETVKDQDVAAYNKTGDIAVFSNVSGNAQLAVERNQENYFLAKSGWLVMGGRFKVEIFNKASGCANPDLMSCLGEKIAENYFNKADFSGSFRQPIFINIESVGYCNITVGDIHALNRAFSFSSSAPTSCGQVAIVNNAPLFRTYGPTFSSTISDLAKNKSYSFQLLSMPLGGKRSVKYNTIKTTSYPDFMLLSTQKLGDPYNGTFTVRATFNAAYDPNSLNLSLSAGLKDFDVSIRKIDEKTIDIVPNNLYFNMDYFIDNLDGVTDLHGNPTYQFDWTKTYFHIDTNPPGTEPPTYVIDKSTYNPNDKIYINLNFNSAELQSRLGEIYLNYFPPVTTEVNTLGGTDATTIQVSASIVNNQIIIQPATSLVSGRIYNVNIPDLFDDNQNYVDSRKDLSFSVN